MHAQKHLLLFIAISCFLSQHIRQAELMRLMRWERGALRLLGLEEGKFYRWPDLCLFVLDRALAEINHLAGFRIGYIPIKRGRKDLPELIEAQKELGRPRVGRTVRRESKAETIADERAALADSLANAPGWSVIE